MEGDFRNIHENNCCCIIDTTFRNQISLGNSGKNCYEVWHTCIAGWGSDALPCTLVGDCYLVFPWRLIRMRSEKDCLLSHRVAALSLAVSIRDNPNLKHNFVLLIWWQKIVKTWWWINSMMNRNYCQPQPPAEHLGLLQDMMRLSPNLKIRVMLEIRHSSRNLKIRVVLRWK